MAKYRNVGPDRQDEIAPQRARHDLRRTGVKMGDALRTPLGGLMVMVVAAAITAAVPALSDVVIVIGLAFALFIRSAQKAYTLPAKMPRHSGLIDPMELSPGNGKAVSAKGTFYLGNDRVTGEEVWLSNRDAGVHMLVLGTTGSGKTEMLLGLCQNALNQGSGFMFVDGKAQDKIAFKIQDLCRARGRDDDVLILNFMTGARDIIGPQPNKITNTMNPFSYGSSGMISQLVVGLMAGGSGGDDMWKDRAISFVEALAPPLTYLRDNYAMILDVNEFRKYFEIDRLEELCWKGAEKYPGLEQVLDPMRNYLINLPGYDKTKYGKRGGQGDDTKLQHGYITMQLVRAFTSLADTYGHIVRVPLGEVYFPDVVKQRRILIAMLPSLEKTPSETANIGKIIVTALRNIMAEGLGSVLEGDRDNLDNEDGRALLPPYVVILDEYGYYAVKGFAVAFAQARPQPLEARVKCPEGWRRMGDLMLGDRVVSPLGTTPSIIKISERGMDDVYRVRVDGRSTEATSDHLWEVMLDDGSVQIVETRDLMRLSARIPVMFQSEMRYEPVQAVEHVGKKVCRCVVLDDSRHLYITDDEIVTHNSLGFVCVVGGQDLASFQRESKEEAVSICGNTRLKAFGSIEDPDQTMDFAIKTAGKALVAETGGFEGDMGMMAMKYNDTLNIHLKAMERIDPSDVKEQKEGQFHFVVGSKVIRAQTYYVNPKKVKRVQLNHFVQVAPPDRLQLDEIEMATSGLAQRLATADLTILDNPKSREIDVASSVLATSATLGPVERSIASIVAVGGERQRYIQSFREAVRSGGASGAESAPNLYRRISEAEAGSLDTSASSAAAVAAGVDELDEFDANKFFTDIGGGAEPADDSREGAEALPGHNAGNDGSAPAAARVPQSRTGVESLLDTPLPVDVENVTPLAQMNVFVPIKPSGFGADVFAADSAIARSVEDALVGPDDAAPLLNFNATLKGVESIERQMGASAEEASATARGVVQGIEDSTRYPQSKPAEKSSGQVHDLLEQLLTELGDQ